MPLPRLRPLLLTLAFVMPMQPAFAHAPGRPGFFDIFNFETITTSLMHNMMITARFFADIRYEQISFDPLAMRLTLLGLDVRPHLHGYDPDACTITAARVTIAGQPLGRSDASRLRLAFDDVEVGMSCLPTEVRVMAFGVGLQQVTVPRLDLGLRYDYASGGGIVEVSADLDQVAALELFVDADYLSLRMDPYTEEPGLALELNSAHLTFDDRGGWEKASRIMPQYMQYMQSPEALQQIVGGVIVGALSDANGSDAPQLSDAQQRFTAEAGAVAKSFAQGARRVVLATNIQGGPLRIGEDSAEDFQAMFDALSPVVVV